VAISGVVVEIGLVKAKSTDGITYSQPTFKPVRTLSSAELTKVNQLAELYRPMIEQAIDATQQSETAPEPGEQAWS
jgi:hypothetical protein